MTARPPIPGEPGSRGDPAPRGDSTEGLITDLGLVVSDAIRRRAGLREQDPAALDRLMFSLGGPPGLSAAEITGRLAVALAQAQIRGAQSSGRPEDQDPFTEQETGEHHV
jgi:hypothetical protein